MGTLHHFIYSYPRGLLYTHGSFLIFFLGFQGSGQEEPGGRRARNSQGSQEEPEEGVAWEPGVDRRSQKELGEARKARRRRRSQEEPRRSQKELGGARGSQEKPRTRSS